MKTANPVSSDLKELEGKTVATPLKGPLAGYIQEKFPEQRCLQKSRTMQRHCKRFWMERRTQRL